jgi:hypothetical protein
MVNTQLQANQRKSNQETKDIEFFNRKQPASGKIYYEDEKGNKWDLIEVFHNIVLMSKEIVRLRKITNKKFIKLVKCIDEAFNKKIVIEE